MNNNWIPPRDALPHDGERVAVITKWGKIYYDVFYHTNFVNKWYKYHVGSMHTNNIKGWYPMSRMEDKNER